MKSVIPKQWILWRWVHVKHSNNTKRTLFEKQYIIMYISCAHHLDINVVLSALTVSVPLPWASYQIRKFVELRMRWECRERFPRLHGLAIPTCMSESLTGGVLWIRWRENDPDIPGACANRCFTHLYFLYTLQWRHNRRDSVSNHQFHGLFRRREKYIKAPRRWPLCGRFTGDRWFPRTNGQ